MTTSKFGRVFRLTVDPHFGGPALVFQMPFTMNFSVERNTLANLNRAHIEIYNLSEAHRTQIFQDRNDIRNNRNVKLEVGYNGQLYRIYLGRIMECSSAREGADIVTRIESLDGQFDITATYANTTLAAGSTLKQVFTTLVALFPNLTLGAIGGFDYTFPRPVALNGNAWDLIQYYSGGRTYIDAGKVYILKNNEVPKGGLLNIDASSGMLNTPRRQDSYLEVTTLLEPSVNIGNIVNLTSTITPIYNGQYPVIGIHHQGKISGAICGHATSRFSLLHPDIFGEIKQVPTS